MPDHDPAAAEERAARDAFEAGRRSRGLARADNGQYRNTFLEEEWEVWFEAWQAGRAALAAPKAEAWQPIETAPKEERESVLITDGKFVGEAFWHDGSQCYGHRGKAGWFWEADRDNLLTASNAHGTHWQPLPAPPTSPAPQEESK